MEYYYYYASSYENENMSWKSKDGKVLKIKEMSSEHLDNSIKFLQNRILKLPEPMIYNGSSLYAEQNVDEENRDLIEYTEFLQKKLNILKNEKSNRLTN
jgi:hypothetical protein